MTDNMKKTVACSKCGKHITFEGKPGEKLVTTCEDCGATGYVSFPKHTKENKKRKTNAIGITWGKLTAYLIVIICFILLVIAVILPTVQGNLHFLTVLSGSMEPNIHPGDIVVSGYVDPKEIQVEDVITFRYQEEKDPDRCITHRVVEVVEGNNGIGFRTKGDANEEADNKIVKPSELIGRVAVVLPYMGYVANFARSEMGFILLILIPGTLIIVNEVFRIIKIQKGEDPDKKNKKIKLFTRKNS